MVQKKLGSVITYGVVGVTTMAMPLVPYLCEIEVPAPGQYVIAPQLPTDFSCRVKSVYPSNTDDGKTASEVSENIMRISTYNSGPTLSGTQTRQSLSIDLYKVEF